MLILTKLDTWVKLVSICWSKDMFCYLWKLKGYINWIFHLNPEHILVIIYYIFFDINIFVNLESINILFFLLDTTLVERTSKIILAFRMYIYYHNISCERNFQDFGVRTFVWLIAHINIETNYAESQQLEKMNMKEKSYAGNIIVIVSTEWPMAIMLDSIILRHHHMNYTTTGLYHLA